MMKKTFGLCALLALIFTPLLPAQPAGASPRLRENFDAAWRFQKGDAPGAEQPAFADAAWRTLDLPHDWSIEGPFGENEATAGPGGYLPTGIGWYRKTFPIAAAMRGRKIAIEFDGVYMNSDVWLNGVHLGKWPYGYTSFAYDLTPHLKFGGEPNVIAVRVDNSAQPNSRWYSGSGIYRHVWLTATGALHVARFGTYVTTPKVSAEAAAVKIQTRLLNESAATQKVTLRTEIVDAENNNVIASTQTDTAVAAGEQALEQTIDVASPRLWSTRAPNLYRLRTTVERDGAALDRYETTFGIRSVAYDVDRGFLLNGEPVKMLGVCLHHDAGAVGAAVPEAVLERRLRLLQAMGCNAIRCSHNPAAPEFYDLCDRLGLLVMDEAFDEWTVRKPQIRHGYSEFFPEWSERDLVTMLHRDRNHPSIVLWSVGNEIGEQRAKNGPDVLRPLVEICHREDPTRPVTAAMDNIFTDQGPAPAAFVDLLDIAGYNYVDRWLDRRETFFGPDRSAFPQRRFVGTEDSGAGGARGGYAFRAVPVGTPERAAYASAPIRVEQLWKFALTHDYVIGHFMWTGIDYLGEARWPNKASSSGALDTCGFPKDSYYLYQSIFTAAPMLHLLPHWNWPGREGQIVPVLAYTNCDVVELTLNGRSLGAKAREFPRAGTKGGWNNYSTAPVSATTADLHLAWDVPYEPGTLKAVGWKAGKKVCEAEVRTAGAPAAIEISVDRETLRADGRDVAHVTVKIVDANGTLVPNADARVKFSVDGTGSLLAVDNGDPASHESFQAPERRAFNGQCLALVRTAATAGEIRIAVSGDGLRGATAVLHTTPAEKMSAPITTL
ncbi:MAG TPA: glycoside hydrolase family 2 TIM barrel-domain containing protein [Opitutaceae bacterium]|nr:glycoside hydrolase family 2 TIM barrel-domain containing protein [Opitutaceae bacterium]